MDIEEFREYCLSLGEVTEKTPFGKFATRFDSVLVFYVCEHMFCMVDMDDFTYAVVKNTPEKIAELHETRNSVERQRNMSAKYWIQLNFG
ncbi:MAG: MmcQ/YjbR family DNA-binding protein, partial [Bacteroides sp.]|nr:MmcQ/YjbR family DNA-binding protein [Bacteroides sp.]